MMNPLLQHRRKSYIEHGALCFWTATINGWKHLLREDSYKEVIISSLTYLSERGKTDVFAFVIMPNHLHLIWRINEQNGKESPQGSFLKYTAHLFKKMLQKEGKLSAYAVDAVNKKYEFWKRDSLAIPLFSREVAVQKLHYIHNNPLAAHWNLVKEPAHYPYSSAAFYEGGQNRFPFLKHLWEEL